MRRSRLSKRLWRWRGERLRRKGSEDKKRSRRGLSEKKMPRGLKSRGKPGLRLRRRPRRRLREKLKRRLRERLKRRLREKPD